MHAKLIYDSVTMSTCLNVETAIRGYHVYQGLWSPVVGELFVSLHQSDNTSDSHAMGVYSQNNLGLLVGHLPREMSHYCHFFTLHEGKISGKVTGSRRHSSEAGGMEIPCLLTFTGSTSMFRSCSSYSTIGRW